MAKIKNSDYTEELNNILQDKRIASLLEDKPQKFNDDKKGFEEDYEYLENLTGGSHYTQKEFETVKSFSKKYNYDIRQIWSAFTNDFYPACKYAGLEDNTIHNLFISLLEYFSTRNLKGSIIAEAIGEFSPMIAENDINPEKYFQHTQHRVPDFVREINNAAVDIQENSNEFFSEFANHIHYNLENQVKERDKNITDNNLYKMHGWLNNSIDWFDKHFKHPLSKIKNTPSNDKSFSDFDKNFGGHTSYSTDICNTELAADSIIEPLKSHIEYLRPISFMDELCPIPSNIVTHPSDEACGNYYENIVREEEKNFYDDIQEQRPIVLKNDSTPPDFEKSSIFSLHNLNFEDSLALKNHVKDVFISVIDDFNRLNGFD